jgi:hypothetical protein
MVMGRAPLPYATFGGSQPAILEFWNAVMKIVQIVVRSASAEAVDIVQRAFHATGLETNLITLGDNEARNAELLANMVVDEMAYPTQVWLLPAAAVDLMVIDEDRAAAARSTMGFAPKAQFQQRLLVTTDRRASEAPKGAVVFSVSDLKSGRISPNDLSAHFA